MGALGPRERDCAATQWEEPGQAMSGAWTSPGDVGTVRELL